eukprot:TRINITY_DN24628_c0_g1_i1.p1 TRINITY_DN24628_c0_g1~~TRINITY_DN24628_c0_g1_i1.p1  ORF type:complete len:665 (+),score=100.72 TRINITY_DN24628_c0_g1_i1:177-2171(+)
MALATLDTQAIGGVGGGLSSFAIVDETSRPCVAATGGEAEKDMEQSKLVVEDTSLGRPPRSTKETTMGPICTKACKVLLYGPHDFWLWPSREATIERELGPNGTLRKKAHGALPDPNQEFHWAKLEVKIREAAVDFEKARIMEEHDALLMKHKLARDACVREGVEELEVMLGQRWFELQTEHQQRMNTRMRKLFELRECIVNMEEKRRTLHIRRDMVVLAALLALLRLHLCVSVQSLAKPDPWLLVALTSIASLGLPWVAAYIGLISAVDAAFAVACGVQRWSRAKLALPEHRGSILLGWFARAWPLHDIGLLRTKYLEGCEALRQERLALSTAIQELVAQFDVDVLALRRRHALEFDADVWPARQQKNSALEWIWHLSSGPVWDIHGLWASDHARRAKESNIQHGRSVHELVGRFRAACPSRVDAIQHEFNAGAKTCRESVCSQDLRIDAEFDVRVAHEMQALESELRSHAIPYSISLPASLPLCDEGTELTLPLQFCFSWMGCPQACSLISVSKSAAIEISYLPLHQCYRCPASRRCNVCGYHVPPGPRQAEQITRHRAMCSAWDVDGRMWRHFFAAVETLPAGLANATARKALAIADRDDFPGVDLSPLAADALVCCPHFGCDESFPGRNLASEHALICSNKLKPQWCVNELKASLSPPFE